MSQREVQLKSRSGRTRAGPWRGKPPIAKLPCRLPHVGANVSLRDEDRVPEVVNATVERMVIKGITFDKQDFSGCQVFIDLCHYVINEDN